ncbi:hypothetical protein J2W46_005845 [Paraburkholderia strydomiana]|nr:hypothetical protein [Paraburkholderia strydomiana]
MAIFQYMVRACATAIVMMFVPHGSMFVIVLVFFCGYFCLRAGVLVLDLVS